MSFSRFLALPVILTFFLLEGKLSRGDPPDDTLHVVHQASPNAHDGVDPQVLAHELSAPVSALNVLTDLLADRDLADEVHDEVASAIKGELRILRSLIADVEELSSPATRHFEVILRPTPIANLFRQAALYIRTMNPDADIRIDCAPDLHAMADPQRIEQVLRNLVGNAVRYTSPGTPIELRASRSHDRVQIEVIDQGPGIPTGLLPRIFDKRVRGPQHGPRPVAGKGLGLYICREIVESHGSRLNVRSSVKKGTTFSFELRGAHDQPAYR